MSSKYQNIQILRIISCIGVFCVHMGQRLELDGVIRKITDFGAMGVYFFFLISGFVTFLSIDNKVITAKKYYLGRFMRLAPVYYVVILFYFIYYAVILKDVPSDDMHLGWLRYFLCLNIFIPSDNAFWYDVGATWTIFIFMLFYLLVPILRKVCNNLKNTSIMWFLLFLISFIEMPGCNSDVFSLNNIHYIMLGGVIYYAVKEKKKSVLLQICIILVICRGVALPVIDMFVWILLFIILIVSTLDIKIDNVRVVRIIEKLDEYSYTIYLVHAVSIVIVEIYKSHASSDEWRIIVFSIGLVGTILLSVIVHEFIEKPLQKIIKERMVKS